MARGKFQTLTEQMFYILLCLRQERCGADVMAWVAEAGSGAMCSPPLGGKPWRQRPGGCGS